MILIPVDRSFRAASVCDEYQVFLRQRDLHLPVLCAALDGTGRLLSVFDLKADVCDFRAEPEFTPAASRYFCIGRIRDSYWLYRVNFSAEKSGSPPI